MSRKLDRRVIVVDENKRSKVIADGPSPFFIEDPARPGFKSSLLWVSKETPVKLWQTPEDFDIKKYGINPPKGGSLCRYVTFPPDKDLKLRINDSDIRHFFESAGAPHNSSYVTLSPHPYTEKANRLDFCFIIEGSITLILDKEEVIMNAGEIVVQRGTNHAWSNHTDKPCTMVISSQSASK